MTDEQGETEKAPGDLVASIPRLITYEFVTDLFPSPNMKRTRNIHATSAVLGCPAFPISNDIICFMHRT